MKSPQRHINARAATAERTAAAIARLNRVLVWAAAAAIGAAAFVLATSAHTLALGLPEVLTRAATLAAM